MSEINYLMIKSRQPPDLLVPKVWSPSSNHRTGHEEITHLGTALPLNICFAEIPQGVQGFLKHKPPEVSLLGLAINLSLLETLMVQSVWSHCGVEHMNLLGGLVMYLCS